MTTKRTKTGEAGPVASEGTAGPASAVNGGLLAIPAPDAPPVEPELKSWALVELFGHQRIVGYLSQQTFGTGVLFRVDVPDLLKDGKIVRRGFTRYFGLSAIYSITPCDEDTVRRILPHTDGTPGDARPLSISSFSRHNYDED